MAFSRSWLLAAMAAVACQAQSLPPALDRYVRAEIELNQLPGVAVVVVRRAEVTMAAYGLRDLGTGEAMTPEVLVELASVSKPLTALAVARLEHEGALDLDRPVAHYLADIEVDHPDSGRITVRHLVEHTSGLTRADDHRVPCCEPAGESGLAPAVRQLRPARPRSGPGRRFRYANSNYVLLAAVVERVSGRLFADYLREQVFEPLGMRRTTLDAAQAATWGLASQHERQWGRFRATPGSFTGWYGASLVKSPASDVASWLKAFLEGRSEFGPAGSASWWLKRRRDAPYQLGWHVYQSAEWMRGELALEHTGFLWGGNTAAVVAPRQGLAVAVLINAGTTRAGPMARGLMARLVGLPGPPPRRAAFTREPDNWALMMIATGAALGGVTLLGCLRGWREWRAGRRRLRWNAGWPPRVRSLLLAGMALTVLYMLAAEGSPLAALPASLRVALPLLALTTAALLLLAAVLGLAPRGGR